MTLETRVRFPIQDSGLERILDGPPRPARSDARPQGGAVVAGQASIAQTDARTTVSQSSQNAALNWQIFDIGSARTVQFQQPNAQAIALNRVVGPNPSEIAGRIEANGQVVVVNQAGVLFHKGAQIDTAGLVVSAAGISNANLMAVKMVFDQPAKPGATVENRGAITVRQQGLAALVAPRVANSGVVQATMGTVVLAGAETHVLDLYGDGMVSINVTGQVRSAPDGTKALVSNTGTLLAQGGRLLLTAEAVDGVVQTLVNAGGTMDGQTMGGRTGRIAVSGRGGNVVVSGAALAQGTDAGTRGGTVAADATGTVIVESGARLSASGAAGGGTVAVGSRTAGAASVARGAVLSADATDRGLGGIVTVLAKGTASMAGVISVRGGPNGGDGGLVEISGRRLSGVSGSVDASAPAGGQGSILLDPDFLTVVGGGSGTGSQDAKFSSNGGVIAASDPSVGADTISNGVLNSFAGNIFLQANKTLTVAADINLPGSSQSLTLEAGGTVAINTGVHVSASGGVTLAAGGAITGIVAQPSPTVSVLGTLAASGGTVRLLGGPGGAVQIGGAAVVQAPTVVVDAPAGIAMGGSARVGQAGAVVDLSASAGDVSQSGGARILAASLRSAGGVGGLLGLFGTGNTIQSLGSIAGTGSLSALYVTNSAAIAVDGSLSAPGAIAVNSGSGALTVNGTMATGTEVILLGGTAGITVGATAAIPAFFVYFQPIAGGVTMAAGSSVGRTGASIFFRGAGDVPESAGAKLIAGTVSAAPGYAGSISLPRAANAIASVGAMTLAGAGNGIVVQDSAPLALTGPISAPGDARFATTAGGLDIRAAVSAGGKLSFASGGTVSVTAGAVLTAPSLSVRGAGAIAIAAGATVGAPSTLLEFSTSSGGVSEAAGAVVQAGTLMSALGVTGRVDLRGTANAVSALGPFSVSGAGNGFLLFDAANVAVAGPLTAPGAIDIATRSGASTDVRGTVAAGGSLSLRADREIAGALGMGTLSFATGASATAGGPMMLVAGGNVSMAAGSFLGSPTGGIGFGHIFSSVGGSVIENTGATIVASSITGAVLGDMLLDGTANAIAVTSGLGAGGALRLINTGSLLLGGTSGSRTVDVVSDTVTVAGIWTPGETISVRSTSGPLLVGAVVLAPNGATLTATGGISSSVSIGSGATIQTRSAIVSATGPIALAAGSSLGQPGAVVDISTTSGGVTQASAATVQAGTLLSSKGVVGGVSLVGTANAVSSLGSFAVSGAGNGFSLVDTIGLNVAGPLTAPGDIRLSTTPSGSIAVAGSIGAGGTLALQAGRGGCRSAPGPSPPRPRSPRRRPGA